MEIRLVLYRIFQEALTNVEKHAAADQVTVTLRRDSDVVNMSIEDNGIGFRVPSRMIKLEQQGHFGLSGMLQRAQTVDGRLDVVSRTGEGTRISVVVPYEHEADPVVVDTPEVPA